MKKIVSIMMAMLMMLSVGCSLSIEKRDPVLSENAPTILDKIYETANLSDEQREAMKYYQRIEIEDSNVEEILGSKDIKFKDAIASAPMMSSVPYQLVLLKLDDDADVEATKELIKKNANPRKWVCVEAEEIVVESIDNTVLFLMANESEATPIKEAFLALGQVK